MKQRDFRDCISQLIMDEIDELGYTTLSDCVYGTWDLKEFADKDKVALDKAMNEAYNSLQVSLRKLSRLGARLDYFEKENK